MFGSVVMQVVSSTRFLCTLKRLIPFTNPLDYVTVEPWKVGLGLTSRLMHVQHCWLHDIKKGAHDRSGKCKNVDT